MRKIHRVQTVQRLIRNLRINLAGTALALDLLEELEELRRQVSGSTNHVKKPAIPIIKLSTSRLKR
ncbi:MAG: hypothetical protein KAI69_06080 [Deltaproteobacteria bacterium]|nr:hypothetical protein [Deltaproteobacteria bacterium]